MIAFRDHTLKAQAVALHYTNALRRTELNDIFECKREVKDRSEAIALAKFYWDMVDASALDSENNVEILGENNLQFWMEKLMNIIGGYLTKNSYESEWEQVSDEA